jgi:hypothetical protein
LVHYATIIHPANGVQTVSLPEKSEDRLKTLQNIVGGYIEVISLGPDKVMVLNEEGKLHGEVSNGTATNIAHKAGAIFPQDFIVGVAVITSTEAMA